MEIARDGSLLTFYVDVKDQATIICPACRNKKSIDAGKFRDVKAALKIKCPCGEEFRCVFEFRKYYRKQVRLEGSYANLKTKTRGDVIVDSLSLEGVGFTTLDDNRIEPGDTLTIRFTLDNAVHTEVERAIKVTSVRDRSVGAMFFGGARNKTVGFYLMP